MALTRRFVPSLKSLVFVTSISLSPLSFAESQDYESALADMQNGDVSSAVIKIKNLLQSSPDNLPARLLYAEILQQYGEFAAAQEQYERALELKVDENLVIVPLARLMLLRGEYRALLSSIDVGGRPNDTQAELLLIRGDAYLALSELESAEQSYRRANTLQPGNATAQLGFAQIALQREDFQLFERLINLAKQQHADNSTVWLLEGRYLQQQRNTVAALEAFSQAILLNAELFDARKFRAAIYLDQDRVDAATQDIDFMLASVPDDPYTLFLKVLSLRKQNEFDAADSMLSDLKNKLSLVPDDVLVQHFELRRAKALTEFYLGNFSEAERQLGLLLSVQPKDYSMRMTIASALTELGRDREALEHLSLIPLMSMNLSTARAYTTAMFRSDKDLELISVFERLPETFQQDSQILNMVTLAKIKASQFESMSGEIEQQSTDALLVKGYGLLSSGETIEAHKVASQIELRAELSLEALNFIGSSYQAQGQFETALRFFERALEYANDDLLVNLNIASVKTEQGRLEEARQILTAQEQRFSDDIRVLFQVARIAQLSGDVVKASEYYGRVNAVSPLEQNTLLNWLDALLKAQQFDNAKDVVYQLEQLNKFSPPVLFGKAQMQLGLGEHEGASRTLRTLLGVIGDSPPHLVKVGELFVRLNNIQGVDSIIQRLEPLKGQGDNIARMRVESLLLQSDFEGAQKVARRLANQTNIASDYRLLSKVFFLQNNIEQAISAALSAHQASATAQYIPYLTSLYWRTERHNDIKTLFEQWLQDNDDDLASRRIFANYLQQRQDFDSATVQYKAVLERDSDDPFSLTNLVIMQVILGNFEDAKSWLVQLNESQRQEPIPLDLDGWIEFHLGDKQKGLSLMRESYVRNARNPLNLYHLGSALIELNRESEGQTMLRRFKQLSNPTTQLYLSRLD